MADAVVTMTVLVVGSDDDDVVAALTEATAGHRGELASVSAGTAAVFDRAGDAVAAAFEIVRRLGETGADAPATIVVHTGDGERSADSCLTGPVVAGAARLSAVAMEGQVIVSAATKAVTDALPRGAELVEFGNLRHRHAACAEPILALTHPDLPPVQAPHESRSLPVPVSDLVGRRVELEQLATTLTTSRLLTITGIGGIGKTRLALELARRLAPRFEGGIAFAELERAPDPDSAGIEIAAALGTTAARDQDVLDMCVNHIGGERLLLVVDDCDRYRDSAAALIADLLARSPRLVVLATGRERFGISGERVWTTPPLSLEGGSRSEAVELFLDRAVRVRPDLVVDEACRRAAVSLCRRLDGVPLALELSAAHAACMAVRDIAGIDLGELVSADRSPSRHRSLESSIRWSLDRLTDEARVSFRRLSVFVGSFDAPAAAAVVGGAGADVSEVRGTVRDLVTRSLLEADPERGRFRMLAPLREFGRALLADADEVEMTERRHADHLATRCEALAPRLESPEVMDALDEIAEWHDDLVAALSRSPDPTDHARLAASTVLYWLFRGQEAVGREHAARAGACVEVPTELRARCWAGAGLLAAREWDADGAESAAVEALHLDRATSEHRAHLALGWARFYRGDGDGARDALESLVSQTADPVARCGALSALAMLPMGDGDWPMARSLFAASLEDARRRGQVMVVLDDLMFLAWIAWLAGDDGEAEAAATEGASTAAMLGDAMHGATCTAWRALIEIRRGHPSVARHHQARALRLATRTTSPFPMLVRAVVDLHGAWWSTALDDLLEDATRFGEFAEAMGERALAPLGYGFASRAATALGLSSLSADILDRARTVDHPNAVQLALARAELAAATGETLEAEKLAHEALDVCLRVSDTTAKMDAIELLAVTSSSNGDTRRGARLLAGVDAAWERRGWSRPPHRQDWLGGYGRAEEGAHVTEKELVAYATRMRGARTRPAFGWDSLTPTEQAVASLIASGSSNKDVADQLLMGTETVKTHLSRVYRKLAVRNRAELAVTVASRGGA